MRTLTVNERRTLVLDHVAMIEMVPPKWISMSLTNHGWEVWVTLKTGERVCVWFAPDRSDCGASVGPRHYALLTGRDEAEARLLYEQILAGLADPVVLIALDPPPMDVRA